MRATVQRDTVTGRDAFGLENAPSFTAHLASLPCWVWTKTERESSDGNSTTVVAAHKMMVPLGTDIIEEDQVTAIKNRRAASIIENPMRIRAVIRRRTHIECWLQEVTG